MKEKHATWKLPDLYWILQIEIVAFDGYSGIRQRHLEPDKQKKNCLSQTGNCKFLK